MNNPKHTHDQGTVNNKTSRISACVKLKRSIFDVSAQEEWMDGKSDPASKPLPENEKVAFPRFLYI